MTPNTDPKPEAEGHPCDMGEECDHHYLNGPPIPPALTDRAKEIEPELDAPPQENDP